MDFHRFIRSIIDFFAYFFIFISDLTLDVTLIDFGNSFRPFSMHFRRFFPFLISDLSPDVTLVDFGNSFRPFSMDFHRFSSWKLIYDGF